MIIHLVDRLAKALWQNALIAPTPVSTTGQVFPNAHAYEQHQNKNMSKVVGERIVPFEGSAPMSALVDEGVLAPVASSVRMQIIYGARMARMDLLRAVCQLATQVTKWTSKCDTRLHQLVCYINSSLHLRMVGGGPVMTTPRCCHTCFKVLTSLDV